MEVLVGPTFTIDVPSSPPHQPTADAAEHAVSSCLFFDGVGTGCPENDGSGYRIGGPPKFFAGESSESSSSIGTPDDSDNDVSSKRDRDLEEEEEEEEVQSNLKAGTGSVSLDSLEESLPIKRGLSSHFVGKSKSFTDLSEVSNVKELQKQESPFNKRRRVLIASKWSRRSAFYSWSNPKSMPLLAVVEDEDDDYDEAERARKVSPSSSSSSSLAEEKKPEDQVQVLQNRLPESYAANMRLRLRSFKSRSFSLADLQEHDDEEDEEN